MNLPEIYDYLVRARRDLWATLQGVPDEVLSRDVIGGPRFHSVKDLIFHIPDVEDGWTNGDIRRTPMVQDSFPPLRKGGPDFSAFPLAMLLDYWRAVEESTLGYLGTLNDRDLDRVVPVEDCREQRLTVDGLLWHVVIHEIRHTAQISLLLRTQRIKPPWLDLLSYLPVSSAR
jgi:uncharacterized damage-inducible protein DinB